MKWLSRSLSLHKDRTLFGQQLQQAWVAIGVYEKILVAHKDTVAWICEIGTGHGILTTYFALWCYWANKPFLTIDNRRLFGPHTARLLDFLGTTVVKADCFSKTGRGAIAQHVNQFPGFFFCDGGQKVEEVRTFSPLLPPNTIMIIHDFGWEAKEEQLAEIKSVEPYEPWHTQSMMAGTRAGVYRCIKDEIRG